MDGLLEFNSQDWKIRSSDGLILFLPRRERHDRKQTYFSAHWTFISPSVEDDDYSSGHPLLGINVIACVPDLDDWRDLAGRECAGSDEIIEDDVIIQPWISGPDLFVHPPGQSEEERADGWDTRLAFGERDGYEFEFEMQATRQSQRAREANREHQLKLLHGEEIPWDWEKWGWLEEGDTLNFNGRVRFEQVSCNVPINSPLPIQWAQQLARRELKLAEFGSCHVNGGDHFTGKFKPSDGIGNEGRLVILNTPQNFAGKPSTI